MSLAELVILSVKLEGRRTKSEVAGLVKSSVYESRFSLLVWSC